MPRNPATKAPQHQRFYTVGEIADALGVSIKTVRRRISDGELATHRIGRQLRISAHDFDTYVASQRRRALAA